MKTPMMRTAILIVIIILFTSCKKENTIEKSKVEMNKPISEKPSVNRIKKIGDYMSDNQAYSWVTKNADSTGHYPRITFQEEFVVYQYYGQCFYWYFTYHYSTGTDKIELLWTYKTDCLYGPESIEKSNGIKKYPKNGDAFCEYSLVNDSVLKVKYNFPEWTNKVNEIEKDSIFPNYLYLEKLDHI